MLQVRHKLGIGPGVRIVWGADRWGCFELAGCVRWCLCQGAFLLARGLEACSFSVSRLKGDGFEFALDENENCGGANADGAERR